MVHLGDITKMSGYTIPPVDVVTFGSPCQDLSIAGKRAGMAGERSGLFSEAVRIIREMRYATFGAYPKYAVWENVPGAFSSNKGEDFHAVLQSLCRVIDPDATIPRPTDARGGIKWPRAGAILADHYSLAWRTMDAQHWGVPQRRLRISLVLDLTGGRAGEILFEPESLRGHFAPGITPGQAAPVVIGGCTEDANRAFTLKIRSGCEGGGKGALVQTEKSATLSTLQDQTLFVAEPPKAYSFDSLASNSMKSSNPHSGCREVEIAKTLDTSPPDPAKNQGGIAILDALPFDTTQITSPQNGSSPHFGDPCHPLAATAHPPAAVCKTVFAEQDYSTYKESACVKALKSSGGTLGCGGDSIVAEPLIFDARGNGDGQTSPTMTGDHNGRVTDYTAIAAQQVGADLYNGTLTGDKAVTLTTATGQGGANTGPSVIEKIIRWIVRRLTPTECERLQGYPDGWTDLGEWIDSKGKTHKDADTPRYKALGNSIALPQWYYVLGGIADRLPDNATLGSLFDGIGGFPYVWAQLHAGRKELCVWASEIEEFPIAVTKKWFPEVEDGKLY